MAHIELHGREIVVHVDGWDRFLALKTQLTIPIDHITGVRGIASLDEIRVEQGGKVTGTHQPGHLFAGTFTSPDGEVIFCDVRHPSRAIVLDLAHDRYQRVIVELSDETPAEAKARIETALAS